MQPGKIRLRWTDPQGRPHEKLFTPDDAYLANAMEAKLHREARQAEANGAPFEKLLVVDMIPTLEPPKQPIKPNEPFKKRGGRGSWKQ